MKKILFISMILVMVPIFIALCCQGGTYYAGGVVDVENFYQQFLANCPPGSTMNVYMIDHNVTYFWAKPMM
jgi:hypothetical protein